jgi:hypothetical protein
MVAIVISPLSVNMSTECDVELCYVKVIGVQLIAYKKGIYKQITVAQEIGYWLTKFTFNLFPEHPLFLDIERNVKLFVKVTIFLTDFLFQSVST